MPRETKAAKRERAIAVEERMNVHYPEAECALVYEGDPFRLTIAVLLSAQTTDKAVNKVTPALWKRYPTPADLAQADVRDVEDIIRTIGFFRTKAANAIRCAQMVMGEFGGEVPRTMEELQRLPGVGRKTANIVLNEGFGIVEGIAVDTHVFRIAHKLKFAGPSADTPAKTEAALLDLYRASIGGPSTISGCSSAARRASRAARAAPSASSPTSAPASGTNGRTPARRRGGANSGSGSRPASRHAFASILPQRISARRRKGGAKYNRAYNKRDYIPYSKTGFRLKTRGESALRRTTLLIDSRTAARPTAWRSPPGQPLQPFVGSLLAGTSTERWENQLSAAAPCQCLTPAGMFTTSPGASARAACPHSWYHPRPPTHKSSWPPPLFAWWTCQWLRQPGSNVTLKTGTCAVDTGAR